MNLKEIGKIIAQARKDAGYTQQALAEKLYITDKAVSKWERGICLPDTSILTRLSLLLDMDIEYFLNGNKPYGDVHWKGEIRSASLKGDVGGTPLVHYLVSLFMLIGIQDIHFVTEDIDYVNSLHLEKYNLNISFNTPSAGPTVVIYDKFLLFGLSLTRSLTGYLNEDKDIKISLANRDVPILITHHPDFSKEWHDKNCENRFLGRGMILLPLNTADELKDATEFIQIYEKYHYKKIADLAEIRKVRPLQ